VFVVALGMNSISKFVLRDFQKDALNIFVKFRFCGRRNYAIDALDLHPPYVVY
jgi:hypothetical protein